VTPRSVLLAIALLAAACGDEQRKPPPAGPPSAAPGLAFTDVSVSSGIRLLNVNGNVDRKPTILESLGQGAAVLDYDRDGDLDLFVCNGDMLNGEPKGAEPFTELYRQDGPLRFTADGEAARVRLRGWFQGAYAADYDGDGWTDLFLTAYGGSRLLRNAGGGRFEDVTADVGAGVAGWSSGAAFLDADRDGDLDLFVARYVVLDLASRPNGGHPCSYRGIHVACGPHGLPAQADVFLENAGGGRFVDATSRFGFDGATPSYGLGVVAFDFDVDGDVDVYVANDSMANHLWENRGGRFVEVAGELGCDLGEGGKAQSGMGVDAADVDLDGRPDVFVTNFEHDTNALYLNVHGDRVRGFFDATAQSGLGPPSFAQLGWGTRILDLDRDGWPDVVVANGHIYPQVDHAALETSYAQRAQVFRGLGKDTKGHVRFEEVRPGGGFFDVARRGRGLLCADFDDDGDQDVFIVGMDEIPRLARNDTSSRGHWVGVALAGKPPNRDAVGAVLVVEDSAGVTRRVERTYGAGFYSTSDPRLWMGLGAATIGAARIVWPDGTATAVPSSALDRWVVASQEAGTVTEWKRP
jgi:hypothetical protein